MTIRMWFLFLLPALAAGSIPEARADGKLTAARELAEWTLRKFTGKATREGAEALTRRIATAAARHGDDLVSAAVRKVGPRALSLADDAAEQAPRVLRFIGRYGDEGAALLTRRSMKLLSLGDDAAAALVRHKGVAEPLLETYGASAVKALAAVSPQSGRRLAILSRSGDLAKIGRTDELMGVCARFGDKACDFVYRNKGGLLVGASLAAFLGDPLPFLDGTRSLAETVIAGGAKAVDSVAAHVVGPAVTEVSREAARTIPWAPLSVLTVLVTGGLGLLVVLRRRPAREPAK
jgi:hypothetical protein